MVADVVETSHGGLSGKGAIGYVDLQDGTPVVEYTLAHPCHGRLCEVLVVTQVTHGDTKHMVRCGPSKGDALNVLDCSDVCVMEQQTCLDDDLSSDVGHIPRPGWMAVQILSRQD